MPSSPPTELSSDSQSWGSCFVLRMQGGPSGSCDFLKCRVLVTCPRFHAANPPPSVATAAGQRTSRGQGGLPCARQGQGQGTGPVPPSGSSFSWALGHFLLDPCSELSGSFRILSLGRSNAAQSPTVISRSRTRLSHLGQTNHTCTPAPLSRSLQELSALVVPEASRPLWFSPPTLVLAVAPRSSLGQLLPSEEEIFPEQCLCVRPQADTGDRRSQRSPA